jgi:hypothetical protein
MYCCSFVRFHASSCVVCARILGLLSVCAYCNLLEFIGIAKLTLLMMSVAFVRRRLRQVSLLL